MYSSAYVWAKILAHIEKTFTPTEVNTFFDDTEVVELSDTRLVLYTPSAFHRDTIQRRYAAFIRDAMRDIFQSDVEVSVLSDDELEDFREKQQRPDVIEFNPQFTFEKFVVGPSNLFAHAAAVAVAKKPAESYNPLFIYGASGLGKTHLLYAIATEVRKSDAKANIVYIKGDQFTNELISALQEGKNVEFRQKYRSADLFLVDDIQFIAGKDSTQEEFFHTFNTLYEAKKQIVLTSDRPPKDLTRLEDRLRTRFEWGLIADVQPPDYETRMAIINNKAQELGLEMPEDAAAYIAENVTNNVRQIEGTVKKVSAYHDLTEAPLDVQSVARIIGDMFKAGAMVTPTLILSEVSRFYSISESTLRGMQKTRGVAEARHIAMYLCRTMTNLSLPDIGKEFGRNHSTVLHSIRKVETELMDPSSGLQDNLRDISAAINARV